MRAAAWQPTTDGYAIAIAPTELIVEEQKQFLKGPVDHIRHACEFETSVMLHLAPRASRWTGGRLTTRPGTRRSSTTRSATMACSSLGVPPFGAGVRGRPAFRADTGEKLFEAAAAKLARMVRVFRDTDIGQQRDRVSTSTLPTGAPLQAAAAARRQSLPPAVSARPAGGSAIMA